MQKNLCLCCVMLLLTKISFAQSEADILQFEKEEKTCLDASLSKINCVALFKKQMDSLLTLSYNNLLKKAAGKEKAAVEQDQLNWLQRQKVFNTQTDDQYTLEVAEKDFSETAARNALSEKADFVRDRVRELVKRMH